MQILPVPDNAGSLERLVYGEVANERTHRHTLEWLSLSVWRDLYPYQWCSFYDNVSLMALRLHLIRASIARGQVTLRTKNRLPIW